MYILLILLLILIWIRRKENFTTSFPIDIVYTWAGEQKSNDIQNFK